MKNYMNADHTPNDKPNSKQKRTTKRSRGKRTNPEDPTRTTPLTKGEQQKLKRLEKRIDKGLSGIVLVAESLRTIRDECLIPPEYGSFLRYCKDRWEFGKSRADQLILFAKIRDQLARREHEILPSNESITRRFSEMSEDEIDQVWRNITHRRSDGAGPWKTDAVITGPEVEAEVKLFKEARASVELEDGGAATAPPLLPPVPGVSALLDAHGYLAGDPPPVEKMEGMKGDGLLVSVPSTVIERPTTRLHLLQRDALPDSMKTENGKLSAQSIQQLTDEMIRIGLESRFVETNANVDWAKYTWNPITGCIHDCDFCYARDIALRYYPQGFAATFYPNRLLAPEATPLPTGVPLDSWHTRVFTGSMGDLFALAFDEEMVRAVLRVMAANPQWTYLVLTKYPAGLTKYEFPPNVWVGTTLVNQAHVRAAETAMANVDATVKWVSIEPLLGPIKFERPELFDWWVIGAQSKTWKVREVQPEAEWVYELLIQAARAGVEVFMKDNVRFWIKRSPQRRGKVGDREPKGEGRTQSPTQAPATYPMP